MTAIHKANILKLGDGLFLRSIRDVAREYTDIGYDEKIIDAACMSLVMAPEKFDVLVLPNLYGDIVSDLGAGLVGGLGVVPGANMGETCAIFEAVHGSAPDIADKNLANPTALLLSGLMMLDHIGEREMSVRIRAALGRVLSAGARPHARPRRAGVDDGVYGCRVQGDRALAVAAGGSVPRSASNRQSEPRAASANYPGPPDSP